VILKSVKKSFVISDRKTFLQGLDNIFVINTQAGLLISNKKDSLDDFKKLVDAYEINDTDIQSQNNISLHEEERPWGSFQVLNKGEGFQSKILKILPNEKISLQKHHHRSEHWVVLEGLARITKDNQTFLLQENESTFIPIGSKHSIKNISSKILKIFEVQTGNFLSEDDIVRYNDKYGRK
jgi:mannose-6-phosphate isomerase-like protein (cupin superfamily)